MFRFAKHAIATVVLALGLVFGAGVAAALPPGDASATAPSRPLTNEVPCSESPNELEVFYETGHRCYVNPGSVRVNLPGAFTVLPGSNSGFVSYDTGTGIVDKRFEADEYVGIPNATVVNISID